MRPRIEAHIAWLEQELKDLDEGLRQTLLRSPVWREKDDLLRTVPGVGEQVSLTLLAYLPELGTLDRGRSPPWWAWLPSTGTAALCGANGPSGAVAPEYGASFTGGTDRDPLEPRDPGLLPEVAGGWQTEEVGSGRVYAQTARHPERYAQAWRILGR